MTMEQLKAHYARLSVLSDKIAADKGRGVLKGGQREPSTTEMKLNKITAPAVIVPEIRKTPEIPGIKPSDKASAANPDSSPAALPGAIGSVEGTMGTMASRKSAGPASNEARVAQTGNVSSYTTVGRSTVAGDTLSAAERVLDRIIARDKIAMVTDRNESLLQKIVRTMGETALRTGNIDLATEMAVASNALKAADAIGGAVESKIASLNRFMALEDAGHIKSAAGMVMADMLENDGIKEDYPTGSWYEDTIYDAGSGRYVPVNDSLASYNPEWLDKYAAKGAVDGFRAFIHNVGSAVRSNTLHYGEKGLASEAVAKGYVPSKEAYDALVSKLNWAKYNRMSELMGFGSRPAERLSGYTQGIGKETLPQYVSRYVRAWGPSGNFSNMVNAEKAVSKTGAAYLPWAYDKTSAEDGPGFFERWGRKLGTTGLTGIPAGIAMLAASRIPGMNATAARALLAGGAASTALGILPEVGDESGMISRGYNTLVRNPLTAGLFTAGGVAAERIGGAMFRRAEAAKTVERAQPRLKLLKTLSQSQAGLSPADAAELKALEDMARNVINTPALSRYEQMLPAAFTGAGAAGLAASEYSRPNSWLRDFTGAENRTILPTWNEAGPDQRGFYINPYIAGLGSAALGAGGMAAADYLISGKINPVKTFTTGAGAGLLGAGAAHLYNQFDVDYGRVAGERSRPVV